LRDHLEWEKTTMLSQTSKFITTDHGRLAYRIDGPDGNPPILLAQRFRGTMDDWDPLFIAGLASTRRVIRFDNAGVGESDGETPDNVPGMADVAIGFLKSMGLESLDLLGWSLGGYVSQTVALNAPGRIRRLIIAGSGPGGVDEGPRPHPRVAEIAAREKPALGDLLFLFFPDTPRGRGAGNSYLQRVHGTERPGVTQETGLRQRNAIVNWWNGRDAARPRLGELTLPILVANGVADVMVPAYSSYVISQEAPDVKLILYPDAGHAFLFQHAEAFTQDVLRFLAA
jgi:pimeloyl-ACP methyl ester carboxylesterase